MFQNPKNIKQEIKLFFLYIVDIAIVAASIVVSVYIAKIFPLSPAIKLLSYLVAGLFGIFLCIRTPSHPKDRMLKLIILMFRTDNNKYYDLEFPKEEKGFIK